MAIVNAILNYLASENKDWLGFSVTQNNNSNAGVNLINLNYTLEWTKVVNIGDRIISEIPPPVVDMKVSIQDIFSNASTAGVALAISEAGVIINNLALATYGWSISDIASMTDHRHWFSALFDHIGDASIRVNGVTASGFVNVTRGAIAAAALPTEFTQATNPTSGLLADDLPKLGLITRSTIIAIQVELDQTNQRFDVRVA